MEGREHKKSSKMSNGCDDKNCCANFKLARLASQVATDTEQLVSRSWKMSKIFLCTFLGFHRTLCPPLSLIHSPLIVFSFSPPFFWPLAEQSNVLVRSYGGGCSSNRGKGGGEKEGVWSLDERDCFATFLIFVSAFAPLLFVSRSIHKFSKILAPPIFVVLLLLSSPSSFLLSYLSPDPPKVGDWTAPKWTRTPSGSGAGQGRPRLGRGRRQEGKSERELSGFVVSHCQGKFQISRRLCLVRYRTPRARAWKVKVRELGRENFSDLRGPKSNRSRCFGGL